LTRLLLVRHGKTEWNESGRYQGASDIPLNEQGLQQAEALRQRLEAERIDVVYSSDLRRAAQTAEVIMAGRSAVPLLCEELREMDFGEFEGLTFGEIRDRYPHIDWWSAQDSDLQLPGGESVMQLVERLDRFAGRLSQHADGDTVLVVAHGGTIRGLICALLGLGLEHWWQIGLDSASLTQIDLYPDRTVLSLLNDTCHVRALEGQGVGQ